MSTPCYPKLLAGRTPPNRLTEPEPPPNEIELQAAWFAGSFGRSFRSTCGREVEIVQFGHWNRSAGPDFVDAVVRIGDGEARRGAIELDPAARDWEAHGHSENPAYNSVVLHVFFAPAASGLKFFTRTENHRDVPQVLVEASEISESAARAEAEARPGRCTAPLAGMGDEELEALLDGAARYRMARKSAAFARYAEAHGRSEALFAGVAEALGYRRNRLPMRVLAGRMPLRELRKADSSVVEALLFGAAGFLHKPVFESAPAGTRDYLRGLWEAWWKRRADFDPARTPSWSFTGSRPTNHPHRRLAALARMIDRWQRWSSLVWRKRLEPGRLDAFAADLSHPYWDQHYTLGSKRTQKPLRLIGAARTRDMLANVILPARLPEDPELWQLYKSLPASSGNQKLRRARSRLFGADQERAKTVGRKLYAEQALLQIYADFCLVDDSDCRDCPFPEQLAQWR